MNGLPNDQACTIVPKHLAAESTVHQVIPCGSAPGRSNPSVQLVKDGEFIKAIDVQCSCGLVTRIVCNYE